MSKRAEQNLTTAGTPRLSPLHAIHQELGARSLSRAGWQIPQAYTSPEDEAEAIRERVGVADLSWLGKLLVRGDADATCELLAEAFGVGPVDIGHTAHIAIERQAGLPWDGRGTLARLAADEFLVITSPGAEETAARQVEVGRAAGDLFATVVDQTSGLAGLLVAGPAGREVLGKLCALPLNARDFPNHRVAGSSLAKVHTILVRDDADALPAFELYFERPYAEYLWACITDAGREVGITPCGWEAWAIATDEQ